MFRLEGEIMPLPKQGHLRPTILVSILKKILAICMISQSIEKMREKILASQAAYQQGRSTTEHIYIFKVLTERPSHQRTTKLLLDMTKDLFDILKDTLEEDKLHMFKMLVIDIKHIQLELERPWENTSTPILEYPKETVQAPSYLS